MPIPPPCSCLPGIGHLTGHHGEVENNIRRCNQPAPLNKMRVYKKVKDVLSAVESFHRKLADRYQEGSVAAQKEDAAMLLAHLSRRERRLQQGLDKFMRAGQEGINETRIQYLSKEGELVLDDMELSSMIITQR